MRAFPTSLRCWLCGSLALLVLAACRPSDAAGPDPQPVRSHLQGRLFVSADVDSIPDYRGFEVLVAFENDGKLDTLGLSVTDSTGAFALDVVAPDRGVYPLIISRRGTVLKVDELAVAEGDSATLQATFPVGNRPLRINSLENGAWAAFKNTRAQHNQDLVDLLKSGTYDEEAVRNSVIRTSMILWSMRETYPKTIGRDLASAEAVIMLGGWDDSLAVAHALEIDPENPSFADVARVARLARARLAGPEVALQLVRDFQARAIDDAQRAQLQSELVVAYVDNGQRDQALEAARTLARTYPDSQWAVWAGRAVYELENLMPGMDAPAFTARTYEGEAVVLDSLRGQVVVLEFYAPQNTSFQRDLEDRNALFAAGAGKPFRLLSISMEPDSLTNEAFLEERDFPGLHVFAPGGIDGELARRYNVNVIPTRYLIDRRGKIVGKYVGSTLAQLQRDVLALLEETG